MDEGAVIRTRSPEAAAVMVKDDLCAVKLALSCAVAVQNTARPKTSVQRICFLLGITISPCNWKTPAVILFIPKPSRALLTSVTIALTCILRRAGAIGIQASSNSQSVSVVG